MATGLAATSISPGEASSGPLDDPLYELIDGVEVHPRAMSTDANVIASILTGELYAYLKRSGLGQVAGETLLRLFPERSRMRRPDVALVSFERWSQDRDIESANGWQVVPELAVEVVGPTDLAVEVMAKVYEDLEAGVIQVWLVYPELRRVHRFVTGGGMSSDGPDGTLDGGDLLPGFELALHDLFRNRA